MILQENASHSRQWLGNLKFELTLIDDKYICQNGMIVNDISVH